MKAISLAMVLAAGRGERIRPLSDVLPKPALPLPEGPVVRWPLRLAKDAGATQIVVNTWHLAPAMKAAAEAMHPRGTSLAFSSEPELLGGAGGLAYARDSGLLGRDGPVLVVNGDCVMSLDLRPLIDRHVEHGDLATMALLPHLDPRRWARVCLDAKGRVTSIRSPGEPDTSEVPFLYSGVMIVSRRLLNEVPSGKGEIGERLWTPARAENRLGGAVVTGHWREVGDPQSYLDTVLALLGDRMVVEDGARVAKGARVKRSLIGRGSVVSRGASVRDSIVSHGAIVASGAELFRSVVVGPHRVAEEESVVESVRIGPLIDRGHGVPRND